MQDSGHAAFTVWKLRENRRMGWSADLIFSYSLSPASNGEQAVIPAKIELWGLADHILLMSQFWSAPI